MNPSVIVFNKPNANGPYNETLTEAVNESSGTTDSGKIVVTASTGQVDKSLIPDGQFLGTHAEPLTDGLGNLVFSEGDVVVVLGVAD